MNKRLFYRLYKKVENLNFVNYEEGKVIFDEILEQGYIESDLTNISINRNINNLVQSASISSLPYNEIYRLFAKYDLIEVYYFDGTNTYLIFIGEIVNKTSKWNKSEFSVSFELLDKLNLLSRYKVAHEATGTDSDINTVEKVVTSTLQEIGLSDLFTVINKAGDSTLVKLSISGDVVQMLNDIRKNYALQVYGNIEGNIVIASPEFLWKNKVAVTVIDVLEYPAEVDISNGYGNINCIIAIGYNDPKEPELTYGIGFDPITYKLNGNQINYRVEYAYHLYGKTDLNKFAINKLLEEQKQFSININNLEFDPTKFNIGDLIIIKNHPEINSERTFIIEEVTHNLNHGSFLTNLKLTGFSLGYIPEDILQGSGLTLGILDDTVNFEMTKGRYAN